MRSKRGITLIALVITIIVLLILAGITISLTIGDQGIIRRTQDATRNYRDAEERETAELDNVDGEIENLLTGDNGGNAEENDDPQSIWNQLKVGDYVKLKYKEGDNGEEQEAMCRVLYDKAYNEENKTNYGVQIISAELTKEVKLGYEDPRIATDAPQEVQDGDNFIKAIWSWNNALTTVNDAMQVYKSDYVTSVRCAGSIPDEPYKDITVNFVEDDRWVPEVHDGIDYVVGVVDDIRVR